jgi:hypothetical protein
MQGGVGTGQWSLIGNAGEYYVMAELLKRGILAALSPRNSPSFDILATKDDITVRIRVKTKSEGNNGWHWTAKVEGVVFRDLHKKDDFTILVNLSMELGKLDYFIIPTEKLDEWLKFDFERWVRAPGINGHIHDPNARFRRLDYKDYSSQLEVYKNKWEIIWE